MYYQTTDRMLSFDDLFRCNMHQKVEMNTFLVTKLKDDNSFTKYDVEASIDEVESDDEHVKLKYRFVLLSNPTNVKISMDGFTTIYGNQQEMVRHLGNDERNIPRVVNTLYQEIFPFLYITSKTMQIPCPAYKLADIAKTSQPNIIPSLEKVDDKPLEFESTEETKSVSNPAGTEKESDFEKESQESLIQEQQIRTT